MRLKDSLNVNESLLTKGFAWHYKYYDINPKWSFLEEHAKLKRIGLWTQPNPIPPWEYRRNRKSFNNN